MRSSSGPGRLVEVYEAYAKASGMVLADPFFSASPEASAAERAAWARERRAHARAVAASGAYRFGAAVARGYLGLAALVAVATPVALTIRSLLRPGGPDVGGVVAGLAVSALMVAIFAALWLRDQRIGGALAALSGVLGGTWGRDRFLPVLDWLDARWPADTPLEVTDAPHLLERRWDLQGSFAGYPVLVHVQRRQRSRHATAVQRVSFFLCAAGAAEPAGGGAAALCEIEAMGLFAKRTPAGVYMCCHGVSPAMLEPGRVTRALHLASSLAAGAPAHRPGL